MHWLPKLVFWVLQQAVSAFIGAILLTALAGGSFATLLAGIRGHIHMGDLTSWSLVFAGTVGWTVVVVVLVEGWRHIRQGRPVFWRKSAAAAASATEVAYQPAIRPLVQPAAVALSAMSDPPSGKGSGPVFNAPVYGAQVGGTQNVQTNTFQFGPKPWPTPSEDRRHDLVQALKSMAPERFFTVASPHAMTTAQQLFSDLQQSGWIPVAIAIRGATPGVVTNMGAPSVHGIKVASKVRTQAVNYLINWCESVGLQAAGETGIDSPDNNVNINFGDPPQ